MNNRCHFFIGRQRMFPPMPFRSHQKRKLQQIECNRHTGVLANTIGTAHGEILPGTALPRGVTLVEVVVQVAPGATE